jgi:hypothetical protein
MCAPAVDLGLRLVEAAGAKQQLEAAIDQGMPVRVVGNLKSIMSHLEDLQAVAAGVEAPGLA